MSANMIKLGLLSLLSTALAVPVLPSGTGSHHPHGTGMAFPAGNDTNAYFPTASGSGRRFRHKTTTTQTRESTTIITEYLTVSPKPVSAAVNSVSTPCTSSTVSVTTTNIVTVTVQPQQSAAAPAVSSAAVEESSAPTPAVSSAVVESPSVVATSAVVSSAAASPVAVSSAVYEAPAVVSSAVASSVVSSAAAPSASSSDEDAVDASAYQGQKQVSQVSAAAASSTATVSTSSVGNNKRGVAYNDVSYTNCFEEHTSVSWGYNWGQVSDGLASGFKYTPMLWGTRSDFLANWEGNAKTAISSGATEILGFNEPDLAAQANMSPAQAATAYKTYITDKFAGKVRLGSPAVTNGDAASGMGLGWLTSFLSACSDCQIDFVAIHWYDSGNNVEYFKQHITDAHTQTGKPVWLTEFGATDGDVSAFLKEVLPWLDQQSFVERYSYFMAKDGILNSGTGLSTIGSTYATT